MPKVSEEFLLARREEIIDACATLYQTMSFKDITIKEIGKITEVLDYPGNKVYVVKGEKEYMIPAVKAFILDTDVDAGTMHVRLIEGMEINAD